VICLVTLPRQGGGIQEKSKRWIELVKRRTGGRGYDHYRFDLVQENSPRDQAVTPGGTASQHGEMIRGLVPAR